MSIVTTHEKMANTIAFSYIYVIKQFTCIIHKHILSVLLLPIWAQNSILFNCTYLMVPLAQYVHMGTVFKWTDFKITFPATDLAACCLMCAKFDWLYAKFAKTIRSS